MTTTTVVESPPAYVTRDSIPERFARVSWGALLAGTFVAVAVWILLYALGLAAGLSSIDPNNLSSARTAGIGTGIWSLIAPLIALFVGGFVASHFAGHVLRRDGILHGIVVWSMTTIGGLLVVGMVLTSLVGAVYGMGEKALGAVTGQAQKKAQSSGDAQSSASSVDYEAILVPVNQRLAQQGVPPITASQLQDASRDVIQSGIASGRLDREALVSSLASNTTMSRPEAERAATTMQQQLGQQVQQVQQVQQGALQAADTTGKAMRGVFLALVLGLASSIAGAAVGNGGPRRSIRKERGVIVNRPATAGT